MTARPQDKLLYLINVRPVGMSMLFITLSSLYVHWPSLACRLHNRPYPSLLLLTHFLTMAITLQSFKFLSPETISYMHAMFVLRSIAQVKSASKLPIQLCSWASNVPNVMCMSTCECVYFTPSKDTNTKQFQLGLLYCSLDLVSLFFPS